MARVKKKAVVKKAVKKNVIGISFHFDDLSTITYYDDRGGNGGFQRTTMDKQDIVINRKVVDDSALKAAITRNTKRIFGE